MLDSIKRDYTTQDKPAILIVDDNEDILDFLSEDLGEKYITITAYNGKEAFEKLLKDAVQLVISDVMMPVMDGFELCEKIKSNFELSHIPVILLTAKNTLQSKIEGLTTGADAYIEKPFSPEYLQAQIISLLNNRNKIKEFFAQSPLTQIKSIAYTKVDEVFLERLNGKILENLGDADFDVEHLAVLMNMSRPTLYRKIKSISNLSPNEMINLTRLKKAAELISQGNVRMNEVAEKVGYNSLTQFGRNFSKQFNVTPTEYAKNSLQKAT